MASPFFVVYEGIGFGFTIVSLYILEEQCVLSFAPGQNLE